MDIKLGQAMNEKYHIFSQHEQRICIELYELGGKLSFKSQSVYKRNPSFKRAMRGLEKVGAIRIKRLSVYPFTNIYELTGNGRAFVEKVLRL